MGLCGPSLAQPSILFAGLITTPGWEPILLDVQRAIPHIYCWFDQADGPYEAVTLYESGYQDHLFLREDIKYRPRRRSRLRAWRDHRPLRKAQRAFEREAVPP